MGAVGCAARTRHRLCLDLRLTFSLGRPHAGRAFGAAMRRPLKTPTHPERSPRLWRGSLRYSENPGRKDSRLSPPATRLHARGVPAGQSCALPCRPSPLCCLFDDRRPCRSSFGLIQIFFRSSAHYTGSREQTAVDNSLAALLNTLLKA